LAFGPSSAAAGTSLATLLLSDNSDISGNWQYDPPEKHMFVLDAGQTFLLRTSQPQAAITLNGYMIIEELPLKGPC
jgi:hypothetical protein